MERKLFGESDGGGVYERRLHALAFAHQQSRAIIPKRPAAPSKSIPAPNTLKTNLLKRA